MAVYYFGTEKQNERNFPSNKKYVCIVQPVKPTPENGKKRISAEQRKKYESDMKKYNKCIALLESGHVDIYNNYLETEDSDNFAVRMLYDGIPERERVFRIKPIQSRTNYGSYVRRATLVVSEFDVEKEIKSSDELLDVLIENYDYFRLENQIFKQGTYANHKEKSFDVFKKLYEKTGDKYLGDLIHGFMDSYNEIMVDSYYNNDAVHDYARELMSLGYVKLYYDKDSSVWSSIIRFLKLKWTDFALETIMAFIGNEEQIKKIKENNQIKSLLSSLTDDSNVKEIIKLLELDTNKLILIVEEDATDKYMKWFFKEYESIAGYRDWYSKSDNVDIGYLDVSHTNITSTALVLVDEDKDIDVNYEELKENMQAENFKEWWFSKLTKYLN